MYWEVIHYSGHNNPGKNLDTPFTRRIFISCLMLSLHMKGIICSSTKCFSSASTFKQFARTFSSSVLEKRILSWLIFLLYVRIIVHADVCSKMVKSFSSHYTCSCLIAGKPWPVHTVPWDGIFAKVVISTCKSRNCSVSAAVFYGKGHSSQAHNGFLSHQTLICPWTDWNTFSDLSPH